MLRAMSSPAFKTDAYPRVARTSDSGKTDAPRRRPKSNYRQCDFLFFRTRDLQRDIRVAAVDNDYNIWDGGTRARAHTADNTYQSVRVAPSPLGLTQRSRFYYRSIYLALLHVALVYRARPPRRRGARRNGQGVFVFSDQTCIFNGPTLNSDSLVCPSFRVAQETYSPRFLPFRHTLLYVANKTQNYYYYYYYCL